MATIPSLALLPSGYKASKVYSVLPTDGVGDFDFTRSGDATRINSEGLIELVSTNVPRLNYPLIDGVVSGCPSLLLEPASTNLITYSEDFSNAYWTKSGSSLTSGFISPDGTANAFKLVENNSTGAHWIVVTSFVETSSLLNKTFSFYVKKGERKFVGYVDTRFSNGCETVFNLENETIVRTSGVLFVDAKIENFGNGYFKCSITYGGGSDTRTNPAIALLDNNYNGTSVLSYTYTGDGLSGNFIFGVQLEAGSYATSYIPTQGATATRVAESISIDLPDTDSFNSSNGFSLITEFGVGAAGSGSSNVFLTVNDDTSSTYMGFTSSSVFRSRLNLSGTAYLNSQGNAPRTQVNSLFISCDSNGWAQGANGVVNNTGINNASVFNKVNNINCITTESYGIIKINKLLIYNTRLSNAELQSLTQI